jgi:hypothetical protein
VIAHWPSPHGCARYLERPGCLGTLVSESIDDMATTPQCSIRVQ